uniref:Maleylacetoacetate isomerase n=1 Tax=Aureoumbra lagunensis TaxID=44058 RepID=A0A6S8BKC6_9STRA|mmetsp:Transcript_13711/g.17117  ORF Transcript_13711/g.17117 Transcript_13711/m.17117 type:complete len:246 (-) Transcript_13711:338-1075(-)
MSLLLGQLNVIGRHFSAMAAPAVASTILHGFPTSSTSVLTRFALHLRGIEFEEQTMEVKTRSDGMPDAVGQKPYLEAEGRRIEQPGAIFNYINELHVPGQKSLLPDDLSARAMSRKLATMASTEIAPFGYYRVDRFLIEELKVDKNGLDKWKTHWLEHGFSELEKVLSDPQAMCLDNACIVPKHGTYLVGDSPTMADVFIQPLVHWSQTNPDLAQRVDLSPFPILKKTYENCLQLPAFQKAIPKL